MLHDFRYFDKNLSIKRVSVSLIILFLQTISTEKFRFYDNVLQF